MILNTLVTIAFFLLLYDIFNVYLPEAQNVLNGSFMIALVLYIVSHIVRIFRLLLLLVEQNSVLGSSVKIHLFSSVVSFILPFKLGDFVRISYISVLTGSVYKGANIVIIERIFDAFFIFALILLCLFFNVEIGEFGMLLATFVTVGIVLFFLTFFGIHPLCAYIELILLKNSVSKRSLKVIGFLSLLQNIIASLQSQLKLKGIVLFILTTIIWSLELMTILIFAQQQIPGLPEALGEAYRYLNSVFTLENTNMNYRVISGVGLVLSISTYVVFRQVQKVIRRDFPNKIKSYL
ncbi:MAG: flippase-like domain-containing protein [Algicola sp.]|nr:flippase-like domain-containing protein [Algicola sp.]